MYNIKLQVGGCHGDRTKMKNAAIVQRGGCWITIGAYQNQLKRWLNEFFFFNMFKKFLNMFKVDFFNGASRAR